MIIIYVKNIHELIINTTFALSGQHIPQDPFDFYWLFKVMKN